MPLVAQSVGDSVSLANASIPPDGWQSQMLELIDPDEFSDEAYARLLEMLDDLAMQRSLAADSMGIGQKRRRNVRQNVSLVADRCLNRREGFRNPTADRRAAGKAYEGDALHTALRYNLVAKDRRRDTWRAGLVLDKDAGEPWLHHPPVADSYSLYASLTRQSGRVRQVVIGHYRLTLGCGLLCDQSFSLGKNVQAATWMMRKTPLAVHASTSETDFMQGAAVRLRLGAWQVIPFLSARQVDGTLANDTLLSWKTDGLHRTRGERDRRGAAWLYNGGMSVQRRGEFWEIAANVLCSHFDHPFERAVQPYNTNYFRGRRLVQGSLDYQLRLLGLHLKGETAVDDAGGWASANALSRTLVDGWQATALVRRYSNAYRQLLANAVAESSAMQGEWGETLIVDGEISSRWGVQASADWFQFTRAQYGIYRPSRGYELSAKAIYKRSARRIGRWRASLRYRVKHKSRNNSLTPLADDITPFYRHSLDAQVDWSNGIGLEMRTQLHARFFSVANVGGVEHGTSVSHAVGWHREDCPLRVEVQGTWFRADDYDCRLYIGERNVRYGFGIPMLYGEGSRVSVVAAWRIGQNLNLEAKYARMNYVGTRSISSGLQRIMGHHQDNVWLMCAWKW